jgi:hypothetical protein
MPLKIRLNRTSKKVEKTPKNEDRCPRSQREIVLVKIMDPPMRIRGDPFKRMVLSRRLRRAPVR